MMFPLRNDVTLDCEPGVRGRGTASNNAGPPKLNPFTCKIIKFLVILFGVLIVLFIINTFATTISKPDTGKEKKHNAEENKKKEESLTDHNNYNAEYEENFKKDLKEWILKEIELNCKSCEESKFNAEQVKNLVKEEIKRQQKTQLKPDFASASAGGLVLDASRTWTTGYSQLYFLFIPIRSTAPPPSIVLEPTREAGDCWPMEGQRGQLLIQLAARANIVGFTMEHIDPAMSLSGGTPEAPNNFSVYGVEDPFNDKKNHLFGMFNYDNKNEEESQYFRVQNVNRKTFLYILLVISSNHGNEKYTCIYRFQVHGFIDRAQHCQ